MCVCVYVCTYVFVCVCAYVYMCQCICLCLYVFIWMTVCISEIAGSELSLKCLLKRYHSLCSLACVYWSTDSKGADTDDQSVSYSCD